MEMDIIFGGLFFQEFFGVFTNEYKNQDSISQSLELFRNVNSIYPSYVGNQVLPKGDNPWSNASLLWLWITLGFLGGILLIVGAALFYRRRKQQAVAEYDECYDGNNLLN